MKPAQPPHSDPDPSGKPTTLLAAGSKILVAEDDLVNQRVATLQLARLGFSADLVGNGREAIAALEKMPYDIVLMDCQMPVMDGLEATRRIRKAHERPIHIIAMTANAMTGDRERCLDAGMDDYLTKPVRLQDLERVLAKWTPLPSEGSVPTQQEEPPVDLARLNEIAGQSQEMFRQIAADYIEQADEILTLMVKAFEKRDARELKWLAHKLGGSSASCGIRAIVPPLNRIEQMTDFDVETVRELVDQTNRELIKIRRFFHVYSETLNP